MPVKFNERLADLVGVLESLEHYGEWCEASHWVWNTSEGTRHLLELLLPRGLVSREDCGPDDPDIRNSVYTLSPEGRAELARLRKTYGKESSDAA